MMSDRDETKILIDSDVMIHFINGHHIDDLVKIYPERLVFVDKVLEELLSFKQYKVAVSNFNSMHKIQRIELTDNGGALLEYAKLIKLVGKGEAACMAIAKVDKNYIASSNLSDIKEYCKKNGIKIITTMDLLWEAIKNRILTEEECDQFIHDVKLKGDRLPVDSIAEYVKQYVMNKSQN